MINEQQKEEIAGLLETYIKKYPSQEQAVATLRGVSTSTAVQIKNRNWDLISDKMWRNVGAQVGFNPKNVWNLVHTNDFKALIQLFEDAKEYSNVFAVTAPEGSGKSKAAEYYESNNQNVIRVKCSEYFNKKVFLTRILDRMGRDSSGNVAEMMDTIVDHLMKQDCPLLILDEADKLNDSLLHFFITLYNELEGKCGIVMLATEYLAKRIQRGRRTNKRGYREVYSRLGRRFIGLKGTTEAEVIKICQVNGLTDEAEIKQIYNQYEGDLRRVDRAVFRAKRKGKK